MPIQGWKQSIHFADQFAAPFRLDRKRAIALVTAAVSTAAVFSLDGLSQRVEALSLKATDTFSATSVSATPLPVTALSSDLPTRNPLGKARGVLETKQATVTGSGGQFTGQVMVNAPIAAVWSTLTDYNNFARFFPNVVDSRLLRSDGNNRVFEQINEVQIFPLRQRSRVVIAATESYPQQISFRLVEGDVESLNGVWRLEAVNANQVMITHQVQFEPGGSAATRGLFMGIYRDTLENTLMALKQEAERRR